MAIELPNSNKVNNDGSTSRGKLRAEEWNLLVNAVKANNLNIVNLQKLINRLSGVEEGTAIIVDPVLDIESENAIQNKAVAEVLGLYQMLLVSGKNIKTINGDSILGEGDIEVATKPLTFDVNLEDGHLYMEDGDKSNPIFEIDKNGNLVFDYKM